MNSSCEKCNIHFFFYENKYFTVFFQNLLKRNGFNYLKIVYFLTHVPVDLFLQTSL